MAMGTIIFVVVSITLCGIKVNVAMLMMYITIRTKKNAAHLYLNFSKTCWNSSVIVIADTVVSLLDTFSIIDFCLSSV